MKRVLAVLVLALLFSCPVQAATVHVLEVKGPIGPATTDYIKRELTAAVNAKAELVVLEMHTPGGLVTSMQDVISTILTSTVPVATYVSPPGSHAASAGTYILYASHIAAMAPGTNLGAATPVAVDGSGGLGGKKDEGISKEALEAKMVNDAAAYIRGLAELRGRNKEWAEQAVREAKSLSATEAMDQKVIDVVAGTVEELLEKIHGRVVKVSGSGVEKEVTLNTKGATIQKIEPDLRTKFLSIITDPNVALLLMTIGVYALIYEFSTPGVIMPGVVGVICLLLGLFALNILPISSTGVFMLLLGFALMAAELITPTMGLLGVGGLIASIIGGVILMDSGVPGFEITWGTLWATIGFTAALMMGLLSYILRSYRKPVTTGAESMVGSVAEVTVWRHGHGEVRIQGEIWQAAARSADASFKKGDRARVVEVQGLKVTIEHVTEKEGN